MKVSITEHTHLLEKAIRQVAQTFAHCRNQGSFVHAYGACSAWSLGY